MGKWGHDPPVGRLASASAVMASLLPHCSRRKPGISEQSITAARACNMLPPPPHTSPHHDPAGTSARSPGLWSWQTTCLGVPCTSSCAWAMIR